MTGFRRVGAYFVVCPSERAYLTIDKEWARPDRGWGTAMIATWDFKEAQELAAAVEWPYGRRQIEVRVAPVCACCGKTRFTEKLTRVREGPPTQWRCDRHLGRNPCLINGCKRTTAGNRPQLGNYICGPHWRLVPKRMKLVYSRIWRLERKSGGWTDFLLARYWRIWRRIQHEAVNRARGDLDMSEIEKMFGL